MLLILEYYLIMTFCCMFYCIVIFITHVLLTGNKLQSRVTGTVKGRMSQFDPSVLAAGSGLVQ